MDTTHNMTWSALQDFLAEHGLTVLEYTEFSAEGRTHHQLVAADVSHKLLLTATSYVWSPEEEVVNNCSVYFVVRRRPEVNYHDFLSTVRAGGSYGALDPGPRSEIYSMTVDYNRPLAARIAELARVAEFVNWHMPGEPRVWTPRLTHFGENAATPGLTERAFAAFLERCQPEVRAFITQAA